MALLVLLSLTRKGQRSFRPTLSPVRRCAGLIRAVPFVPANLRLLQLFLLLPLKLQLQRINRGRRSTRRNGNRRCRPRLLSIHRSSRSRRTQPRSPAEPTSLGNLRSLSRWQLRNRLAIRADNLHQEEEPDRVFLEASSSSLRTCRTIPSCKPPGDPAAHTPRRPIPSFRWSMLSR